MGRKRQEWTVGDLFLVPTLDGEFGLGQVIGREPSVLNSAAIALFDRQVSAPGEALGCEVSFAHVFSILFVTRDLLDSAKWRVVGRKPVEILPSAFPFEDKRASGFVGAKVVGSGNVATFVNAYFGLSPWDDWQDPEYLTGLLIRPERVPPRRILKNSR